ncbi:MAG: hypothetical protein ACPGXK_16040 [Phycisphaerae bacterium]
MSKTYGDYWFYHPTATVYGSPRDVDLAFEDVHFESEAMQQLVPEFMGLLEEAPDVSYFEANLVSKL